MLVLLRDIKPHSAGDTPHSPPRIRNSLSQIAMQYKILSAIVLGALATLPVAGMFFS